MVSAKYWKFLPIIFLVLYYYKSDHYKSPLGVVPPWPVNVGLNVYRLNNWGVNTWIPCSPGDTNYGCTFFCTNYEEFPDLCQRNYSYSYPYAYSSVNIPLETYYLLNVLTAEMDPSAYKELPTLKALAIAERSYVGYHISHQSSINNSTQY
jgi:hypothetical protein